MKVTFTGKHNKEELVIIVPEQIEDTSSLAPEYLISAYIGKIIAEHVKNGKYKMTRYTTTLDSMTSTTIVMDFKWQKKHSLEPIDVSTVIEEMTTINTLKEGETIHITAEHKGQSKVRFTLKLETEEVANYLWLLMNIPNYNIRIGNRVKDAKSEKNAEYKRAINDAINLLKEDANIKPDNSSEKDDVATSKKRNKKSSKKSTPKSEDDKYVDVDEFVADVISELNIHKYSLVHYMDTLDGDVVKSSGIGTGMLLLKPISEEAEMHPFRDYGPAVKTRVITHDSTINVHFIEVTFSYKYTIAGHISAWTALDCFCD